MGHLFSTTLILTLGHGLWTVASEGVRCLAPVALSIIFTPVADVNIGEGISISFSVFFFIFALFLVFCYKLGDSLLSGTKGNYTTRAKLASGERRESGSGALGYSLPCLNV